MKQLEELFRNTLTPAQWAAVAAAPLAIFALYFLKLRREPLEVPSTYLWAKSIEDLRVNSLWQRLRQSLLLLLQLLAVAAAALALLRPGWSGTATTSGRLIFLVDNSASMATEDAAAEEGVERSRLEDAKRRVAALIDQMDRGATAMIVSFASEPRVVQEFTDNQRRLREALATIEPTAERTDLRGALELADGLANPTPVSVQEGAPEVDVVPPAPATLMVFSDGRFADVEEFALGNLDPVYVPIGSPETGNLAVTALETRPSEAAPGELMAFVQATNFGADAAEALVELRRGDRVIDARRLSLPAGESAGATVAIGEAAPGTGGGVLEARIARDSLADAGDKLALDNRAVAAINPAEPATVLLVTPDNVALERALGTGRADRLATLLVEAPAFLEGESYGAAASGGAYDVVVYDRCLPKEPPRASAAYVGVLPPGDAWREAGAEPEAISVPQIIDWNRAHPVLAHLELGDFDIVDATLLTPPPGAASLVDAAEGPIVAIAGRDGFEDLVIGFPILVEVDGGLQRNTDWINRHSFPTFWLNTLEYFVGGAAEAARSRRPGEAVEFRPRAPATESVTVTKPSGARERLSRRGDRPFVFRGTDELGLYLIEEAGEPPRRFAVNLLDAAESDVRLREAPPPVAAGDTESGAIAGLRIGNTDVAATVGSTPARRELWRLLLVGVLVLLALEWWVYHRRVYL